MAKEKKHADLESWGEIVELNEVAHKGPEGRAPIVYNFRPTRYIVVAPERLKDWEEYFAENTGLQADRARYPWTGDPRETISGSNDGWDDCDCW